LKHKWNFVPKKLRPKDPKRDYFVPSFGEDPEITDTNDSEVQAQTEVWSSRLGSQIGEDQAAAQIATDAASYRADAEKAQREADAAAAKAAAAEADAQAAADKAVENDFKDKLKANVAASNAAEAARVQEYNKQEATTRAAYAAAQVEKEKDHAYYLEETRARTQASYDADRANSEAILAKAAADKEAAASAKAALDAAEAEKIRQYNAVKAINKDYMVEQRLAGMREDADYQNINLDKERAKQAALKAAEDAARAKFWEEYERLHGETKAVAEKVEASEEAAKAEAEAAKVAAEAKDKAERQKEDEEAMAKMVKDTAEADAATKRAILDQQKAEDASDAKIAKIEKDDEVKAKKEAVVTAKAVEEAQKENESIQKAAVEKIDVTLSKDNLITEMIKADDKVGIERDVAEKVEVKAKEEKFEKAKSMPPLELTKSLVKESAEKAGMNVVNESGAGPLELVPKTKAAPIDANKKEKTLAKATLPAELSGPPAATKVMFNEEDFHISI